MAHTLSFSTGDKLLLASEEVSFIKSLVPDELTKLIQIHTVSSAISINDQFDSIVSFNTNFSQDSSTLSTYLKLLKPSGTLHLYQPADSAKKSQVETSLLISGFVKTKVTKTTVFSCKYGDTLIEYDFKNEFNAISSEKPNYEVGSSKKLSLPPVQNSKTDAVAAVWKLDDDDDYINADDLLNEDDLKRPDASTLKVCGTTGKRKACKDCSCGLAEELEAEKKDTANAKSSCGNCYLGDAFRCASCPYLGMPAFKPGEKVQLNDNLLSSDI